MHKRSNGAYIRFNMAKKKKRNEGSVSMSRKPLIYRKLEAGMGGPFVGPQQRRLFGTILTRTNRSRDRWSCLVVPPIFFILFYIPDNWPFGVDHIWGLFTHITFADPSGNLPLCKCPSGIVLLHWRRSDLSFGPAEIYVTLDNLNSTIYFYIFLSTVFYVHKSTSTYTFIYNILSQITFSNNITLLFFFSLYFSFLQS